MFQFTTRTVINNANALDYSGQNLVDDTGAAMPKFYGSASQFVVTHVATFKKAFIKGLYKSPYTAGAKEKATLTVPSTTAGDLLRVTVNVKLDQTSTESSYANMASLDFKQPQTIELIAVGTPSTDASNFAKAFNKLKVQFGKTLFVATVSGATITFTAKDNNQKFENITLEKVGPQPETAILPTVTKLASGVVTVNGKIGFGDDLWMIRNIRIPNYPNQRAYGINREEIPVMGGNYSQYTIRYEVPSETADVFYGGLKSITTHIFYVKADLVNQFEAEIEKLGINVGLTLTADKTTIDVSDATTATISVAGSLGKLTFVSETPAAATVSSLGIVTPVAAGTTVITATDAVGNTGTITITVQA